ncbi:MAG TPA: peptidoglycan-binding domain-containing protein [Alphaproteobacteria bacterium]|nr:peptidoglycan-binding domain-containing protein [Alphaproteobacteria bacterium]
MRKRRLDFAAPAALAAALAFAGTAMAQTQGQPGGNAPAMQPNNSAGSATHGTAAPQGGGNMGTQEQGQTGHAAHHKMMHKQSQSESGSQSDLVKRAQQALNEQGAHLNVDGKMGPKTRESLKNFQEVHHIPATGKLDQKTRAALKV